MSYNTCIVISHYLGRDINNLNNLISQLTFFKENIIVIVNSDHTHIETLDIINGIKFVIRPNIGMNIGGWGAAIKYCNKYDKVIFLQDECIVNDFEFLPRYSELLDTKNTGIVGESINFKWNKSWDSMANSPLNYQVRLSDRVVMSRVEYYIQCLNKWRINPGKTAKHLRSLVWGFNTSFLSIINGFPIGNTKEECIASEIGVSKLVEQHNLNILQSSDNPFQYIHHKEWNTNGWAKI